MPHLPVHMMNLLVCFPGRVRSLRSTGSSPLMTLYSQSMMVKVTHSPDLIVDDGGDMNLLIHDIIKAEDFFSRLVLSLSPDPQKNLSPRMF